MDIAYLDNNATTPLAPEVVDVISDAAQRLYANPSSTHRPGQEVRQRIELARQAVAGLIGGKPREITFTSGGTEANNLALRGLIEPELWRRAKDGIADLATAPAIVFVACIMARGLAELDWDDVTEYAPAVITALTMPLTFSIATGIGLGFIAYVAIKLLCGRLADISAAMWLVGAIFVIYFATV